MVTGAREQKIRIHCNKVNNIIPRMLHIWNSQLVKMIQSYRIQNTDKSKQKIVQTPDVLQG